MVTLFGVLINSETLDSFLETVATFWTTIPADWFYGRVARMPVIFKLIL